MNARARRWTRVEALAIVLIFDAAVVFVAAIHNDRAPLPPTQAAPAPSVTSPAVTPPPSPARHSTEGKPVHIEQRAGATVVPPPTAAPPKTSPRPTSSPTPTPPSYSGTWTVCGPTADGDLFCRGKKEAFTCSVASGGDASCRGSGVSFSCTTDVSTGARECGGASGSWQCMTDANTGRTGCQGGNGTYSCGAQPGTDETCVGTHNFSCYDKPGGRTCGTESQQSPDCFFEPIFGVYCRA
ncbi:MAG: hypothetical protein E6G04_01125 [Actinobacteria bacterium]|nr:MAG: hypothetical protein E6G04_01125 [Actinomycetota bacterium]